MTRFGRFLRSRLETGGFSTEDALASFLPLAREIHEAHNLGLVGPLDGIDDLQVEGVRIWFEEAKRRVPRSASSPVRDAEQANRAPVEVVSETRITTDVDHGVQSVQQLAIGDENQPITRPVYLPGYRSWEHRLDCHDPLTDIFSLGMILASMVCGLDFNDRAALETFVAHRKNLFQLTEHLHPVIARAIVCMSEVDRRRRAQDLGSLLRTLENYRDQEIDFDFDLARSKDFDARTKRDKQTVVLAKLRERLFEISRRNRLLHFRPTMQSVNLTHASVPLSFDIKNIRPEQILTWNESFQREVASGKEVSLNKYLNFSEVLYLPSLLQRLISETRRDQAEFGFAQLRLVVGFIHWANLKEEPAEQYDSPLILLPVELGIRKGIRDTYYVKATTSDAEINPVVRHQFKQLYDIDLPEQIDLSTTKTDDLFISLRDRIETSEAAVTLEKIDRPRIQLIHEKARRKLDQYRRRAKLAGRGVRKFMNVDYSYDPANYHPLGIRLFSAKIRPSQTHLREIIEENPRPRSFAAQNSEPPVVEKERQFYALAPGGEESPYDWKFDLCGVTLANFRYRRMSLVRDYEALLADDMTNPAFEATFSLTPRTVAQEFQPPRPLDERFDVVACDPTQALAIAKAASGQSYIIQGPPGTGKSQTITNLIADYVARGKRVLFVCEKRAAIDVVYARLRQCGLSDLCCLIHDSQTDKKKFVMDLKRTYEAYLAELETGNHAPPKRSAAVGRLKKDLAPLERFDRVMQSEPPAVGMSVRRLLDRCIALRDVAPPLDSLTEERLPSHAQWLGSRAAIGRFQQALREAGGPSVLARHPLRILAPRLAAEQRPLQLILGAATEAKENLDQVTHILDHHRVPRLHWQQLGRARLLVDYAGRLSPLVEAGQVDLLDQKRDSAKWFVKQRKRCEKLQQGIDEVMESNRHWLEKLSLEETDLAVDRAAAFERSALFWLWPDWWRLRRVMHRCYNFKAHKIRPVWSHVLRQLHLEYGAQHELRVHLRQIAGNLDVDEDRIEELIRTVDDLTQWLPEQPHWLRQMHAAMLDSPQARETVPHIASAAKSLAASLAPLAKISDDAEDMTIDNLVASLRCIIEEQDAVRDFLDCLRELQTVPNPVASALRSLPHTPREIEAAVSHRCLNDVLREERQVERFTAKSRQRHVERLNKTYQGWLVLNAAAVRDRVGARFLESLQVAERPAVKLAAQQQEFKRRYSRGRRELEHEFGKQMRYKAIRDLVADESGDVVKDLKPVWLMSPLSVSDTLPLDSDRFDVVIFDEASQITLEEAVPALFRAPQSIIVGDQMQLPPTDFFSAKRFEEEDEDLMVESEGELVRYDLDSGSFLNHAAQNLSSTMLGWHYRSRSESLISFSNWTFYDGRLLTVPEESLAGIRRPPILASAAEQGVDGARATLARPVSFHRLGHGVYDKRRNRAEAEYIAEMLRALLNSESKNTIGIIAFSEAQQDEIEQAVARLSQKDNGFRKRLEAEWQREDDSQFVGLLIKNLENIQGDERDIIILSVCYGHPADGKMRMNFGPINKSGGEKRLNVAFSRAKRHMAVVSSIDSDDITNDYNDGANCLKNYLRYAQAVSIGDAALAFRILRGLSRWPREQQAPAAADVVAEQLVAVLTAKGYEVDRAVGQSHFRCDLAVCRPGDTKYRLGILIDNASYYEQADLIERDLMRPRLLEAFGWRIVHVLAKDWHADADAVTQQLLQIVAAEPNSNDNDDDRDGR